MSLDRIGPWPVWVLDIKNTRTLVAPERLSPKDGERHLMGS